MHGRIRALDDTEAIRILKTISATQDQRPPNAPDDVLEVLPALRDAFRVEPNQDEEVKEGELARAALLVYADAPAYREGLKGLLDSPMPPERYGAGTGIAITTAVLVALQTRLRFERTEEGRWTVLIEKKWMESSDVLALLVQKLMGYLKGR